LELQLQGSAGVDFKLYRVDGPGGTEEL